MIRLEHGDCIDVMRRLAAEGVQVDAVITSPPYAEQRAKQYGGVPEADYPAWTVEWMRAARALLKPTGSVAINIRPHLRNGQISDYVLRTRLALRADGWRECDELIWHKPDSAPMGRVDRPRRSWESVHWFALTESPFCAPKANGHMSRRIGFDPGRKGLGDYIHTSDPNRHLREGMTRCQDVVTIPVGVMRVDEGNHPARYPQPLAEWLARLLCPPGGVVLDPFVGSGTTMLAALQSGMGAIGIEREPEYVGMARRQLDRANWMTPADAAF